MGKMLVKNDPITRDFIATKKEAELFQERRKRLGDKLVEKWNRTKFGRLDRLYSLNPQKARNTAIALENTHRELTLLKENGLVATTLFRTQPENVLKVVRIGVANRNRGDIFDEYQLLSLYDALYFINRTVGESGRDVSHLTDPSKLIYEANIDELLEGSEIAWDKKSVTFDPNNAVSETFNIPEAPILPYTVKVYIEGVGYVGTDDGNGKFVSQPLSITGSQTTNVIDTDQSTINYQTGEVNIMFNGLGSQASKRNVVVEGHYNSESKESFKKFPKISLRIEKRNWRPRPYPIQWEFTQMLSLFFRNPQFGNVGDVSDMLVKAAGDEHAIRADLRALQDANRISELNPIYKFDANYVNVSDNDFNHAQRIYTVIQNVIGQIYNELGRGGITSIVATPSVANYIAKFHKFEEDNTQPRVSGTFLFGNIGPIRIYQTRANQGILKETQGSNGIDGEMLIICKNPDEVGEPSIAWGVLAELSAVLDYPELYRSGVLATVEDRIIVQPKFIRKMKVTNIRDLEVV